MVLLLLSAWVGSIAFGLTFMTGPLSTALCTKFGCRVVTVLGAFLFGLGLLLSSYANSIYLMFVTYSLLLGVGSSFSYYTSILILNEYFSKRLVLVNGIGLSGCGFGTLALAPLMNFLLDTFHWRVALRILSASSIVLGLCGLVYFIVPVPVQRHTVKKNTKSQTLIDVSFFKNKAFVVWLFVVGFVLFGFYMPYVHLVSKTKTKRKMFMTGT